MADSIYETKVHFGPDGDTLVVESGGVINVAAVGGLKIGGDNVGVATIADVTATATEINKLDGAGAVVASGTQAVHRAALKVNYTTGDLDTEAKIIAALNATNAAINQIMTDLAAFQIRAAS